AHRLRRHLRGHIQLFVVVAAHELADETLAVAGAIDERGVDEVHAELEGAGQRRAGVVVATAAPHRAADRPGAEADLREGELAVSEAAVLHGSAPIERSIAGVATAGRCRWRRAKAADRSSCGTLRARCRRPLRPRGTRD